MNSSSPEDRRRHVRVPIRIEVQLRLLRSDDTPTPDPIPAVAMNLSSSGIKIITRNCPDEVAKLLLKTIQDAEVEAILPGSEETIVFLGRIAWMDLDRRQSPPLLTLGISFSSMDDDQLEALSRCAESIQKSSVNRIVPHLGAPKATD